MRGYEHNYNRCTTPARIRRGVQKRIIEQVEEKVAKLSIEELEQYEYEMNKLGIKI